MQRGVILLAVVHQAQAQGFGSVEAGGGQGQAARLGQADAVYDEGGDLRREDAQRGFRQTELGAAGGDGHIGHAGQAEAAAKHGAFQHGHQYLRRGLGFFQQRTESAVQLAVGVAAFGAGAGHVLDVATGAEVAAGAAQHKGAHVRLMAHGFQGGAQFADHGQAHGVAAVRAVEGDVQHATFEVQQQGFAVGQVVHRIPRCRATMAFQARRVDHALSIHRGGGREKRRPP